MEAAEGLYQRGYISYPRTETQMFIEGTDLRALIHEQRQSPTWGGYAAGLLDHGGFAQPRAGSSTDNAHPPIHPTKWNANDFKNTQERRVYEFVVRHFLACCSEDATGQETNVTIDIAAERFHAKGLIVEATNYLDIYTYEKWNTKKMPDFMLNQSFTPTVLELREGKTQRPKLLTEA